MKIFRHIIQKFLALPALIVALSINTFPVFCDEIDEVITDEISSLPDLPADEDSNSLSSDSEDSSSESDVSLDVFESDASYSEASASHLDLPDSDELDEAPPFLYYGVPDYVEVAADDHISLYAASDADEDLTFKNVVVYQGTFNNQSCSVVFPIDALESLDIINGYLVNVSGSSVSGRLLYSGDTLDPALYDCYDYILAPLYGSTQNVYSYGSRNYQRHYYLNTQQGYNRITYSDMYGNFYVDTYDRYYSEKYRIYYLLVFFFLCGGVFALCRKH